MSLTRELPNTPWKIASPNAAIGILTTEALSSAATLLSEALLELPRLPVIDVVIGLEAAANAFLNAWVARSASTGPRLVLQEPALSWRTSYATKNSLPPPITPCGTITLASSEDLDALIPLHVDFVTTSPWPAKMTEEAAVAGLTRAITAKVVWIYKADGLVAGYAIVGRPTPRTIAIQNVYVGSKHRRKGIAEALVRATTRYYLGVTPSGAVDVPDVPPFGVKAEVSLLVVDPSAEGVYRRSGFLFPAPGDDETGGWDPVTGQKAWFRCVWQGTETAS